MLRRALLLVTFALFALPVQAATLFDELGGEANLRRIVDDMVNHTTTDPRIAITFAESNIPRLKRMIYDQFCELSGGPCRYTGRDMARSHAPFQITDAHFAAVVENLQDAMDRAGVAFYTQNKLLALLAPMRRDMVTR